MAGNSDLLNRLIKALGAFDDRSLVAITSVGLVRRARKDLENQAITLDPGETSVRIHLVDAAVTMDESGPANARCTCAAGGKCRHVLMAAMHLKEQSMSSSPGGISVKDEMLALTTNELSKWVGRKTLREAMRLVQGSSDIDIVEQNAVTVRFPSSSIECRYFPGTGLTGMVTTAPGKLRERFLAAAVLAYQIRHGISHDIDLPETPAKSIDAPRTREQILQSANQLLEEIITIGIAHVSGSARDRLQTLSVSCVGGQLPRLALMLKSLADEVSKTLRRDAAADDVRMFDTMSRCYALCHALASAGVSPMLIGQSRTRYEQTGGMQLTGVGAYAWRTRSGYHGLTVLFWDSLASQFCSWSDSRPIAQDPSFKPISRYEQDIPWQGSCSARVMSKSKFRLSSAGRNDDNRLSSSQQCQAAVVDQTDPGAIDFGSRAFDDWIKLRHYLAEVMPAGLEEHSPLDRVVVLKPAAWGSRTFRRADQRLVWPLADQQGSVVLLNVPFDTVNQQAVERLEAIDVETDSPWGIVGSVTFDGSQVQLLPYSLLRTSGPMLVQNLNLDIASSAKLNRPVQTDVAVEANESANADLNAMFAQWGALEEDLQRLAESGVRNIRPDEEGRLEQAVENFTNSGLVQLSTGLRRLLSQRRGGAVLQLGYLCKLHRQLATRSVLKQ